MLNVEVHFLGPANRVTRTLVGAGKVREFTVSTMDELADAMTVRTNGEQFAFVVSFPMVNDTGFHTCAYITGDSKEFHVGWNFDTMTDAVPVIDFDRDFDLYLNLAS